MIKCELVPVFEKLKEIQKSLVSLDFNYLEFVVKIEELLYVDVSLNSVNELRKLLLEIVNLDEDIRDECSEHIEEIMETLMNVVHDILNR